MTYNGIELTAEDILRIALIEPTDTPEEKAAIERAIGLTLFEPQTP